jgi:hypothetical protein
MAIESFANGWRRETYIGEKVEINDLNGRSSGVKRTRVFARWIQPSAKEREILRPE